MVKIFEAESENKRYYDLNTYFRQIFNCRVQKVSVDAGLSCPNRDGKISTGGCIYCNARGSGTGAFGKGMTITSQLEYSMKWLEKRYKAQKFIAYFQSFSNTYAPIERLKEIYDQALAVPGVVGLSIGTRPDCVNDSVLKLLGDYAKKKLIWIEYGIQSMHDSTLAIINRGHDVECFVNAVQLAKNYGLNVCAHVILGLPDEDKNDMLATARKMSSIDIDGVKIHLLYVIKGTPLEKLYNEKKYECLKQKEYVDILCDFIGFLPEKIVIQRITGDPHPEELIAPKWSLDKMQTRKLIYARLEEKNIWQGKFRE